MMKAFFAAVLSVIAIGVMLIAYGLFNPRVATAGAYPTARPMLANERVGLVEDGYAPYANYPAYAAYTTGRPAMAYPVNDVRAVPATPVQVTKPPRRRRRGGSSRRRARRAASAAWNPSGVATGRRRRWSSAARRRPARASAPSSAARRARSSAPRSAAAQGRFTSEDALGLGAGGWGLGAGGWGLGAGGWGAAWITLSNRTRQDNRLVTAVVPTSFCISLFPEQKQKAKIISETLVEDGLRSRGSGLGRLDRGWPTTRAAEKVGSPRLLAYMGRYRSVLYIVATSNLRGPSLGSGIGTRS